MIEEGPLWMQFFKCVHVTRLRAGNLSRPGLMSSSDRYGLCDLGHIP